MTANNKWPEVEALTKPQCALCKAECARRGCRRGVRCSCTVCIRCPIVTARVFKQKMNQMMDIVKRWEGGMEYYFLVVEWQHRGQPHYHLALRCKDPCTLKQANAPLNHADSSLKR